VSPDINDDNLNYIEKLRDTILTFYQDLQNDSISPNELRQRINKEMNQLLTVSNWKRIIGEISYDKILNLYNNLTTSITEYDNTKNIGNSDAAKLTMIKYITYSLFDVLESISESMKEKNSVSKSNRTYNKEKGDIKVDYHDSYTVAYCVLEVDHIKPSNTLLQIADALNLKLNHEGEDYPFIFPKDFEKLKSENKVFLYGITGSGKNRLIYEIIKDKITSFNKIYLLNPQLPTGRISVTNLVEKTIKEKDAIIWVKYSDDLLDGQDVKIGQEVLIKISSAKVNYLFISLNHILLETYRILLRRTTPYLKTYEIIYDKETFKNILVAYGKNISKYKTIYEDFITKDINRISEILYNIDPNPLTILLYYEDLTQRVKDPKNNKIAIDSAKKFSVPTDYYKQQFSVIRNERLNDLHFLYTMKICYDAGLKRTYDCIEETQKGIFGSELPIDPTRYLSYWVSINNETYYTMPYVARNVIEYPNDNLRKVMKYLTNKNFFNSLSQNVDSFYLFGVYLGKNIQFTKFEELLSFFLSKRPFTKWKDFITGIGIGIGKIFAILDVSTQRKIMDEVRKGSSFAAGFGDGISREFPSLDHKIQDKILALAEKNDGFALRLGYGLAYRFPSLDHKIQDKILALAEKNDRFMKAIYSGLAYRFPSLDHKIQDKILALAEKNNELAHILSKSITYCFTKLEKDIQQNVLHLVETNIIFAEYFGKYSSRYLSNSDVIIQEKILALAEKNDAYALLVSSWFGHNISDLSEPLQEKILALAEKNSLNSIGYKLGKSISYNFPHSSNLQEKILALAEKNNKFTEGLGKGIGRNFALLNRTIQERIFDLIKDNNKFAYNLAYSIGDFKFALMDEDLIKRVFDNIKLNNAYSKGLAAATKRHYEKLNQNIHLKISETMKVDPYFAEEFGSMKDS
jgi:hypothetical protein